VTLNFNLLRWPPYAVQMLNWSITVASVLICLLILPTRFPGMTLLGVGPNWLLIWVVAWSVNRTVFEGMLAGLVLGWLQDGVSAAQPTHALSLILVGALTARLQKQRYIQEDFISIALIVFGMAVLAETVIAVQFSLQTLSSASSASRYDLGRIWLYHQQIALASAILSSLWAPTVYYPLNRWWEQIAASEQPPA
jgi:rod shape-determining protein MreD